VYFFYGENPLPLYVGKSVNLRERIGAHFAGDWRSETDLRLSQEIRRVEFEETAGEFGALLREAQLVKTLLPAHNRALRRKEEAGVVMLDDGVPRFVAASGIEPAALASHFGPFATRRASRETLRALAAEHALCWRRLGLDQRTEGPCFQRQLKRCAGACVGAEDGAIHDARLRLALAPLAIPRWPAPSEACLREHDPLRERTDVHVLRDWCWLGTARDESELAELASMRAQPVFDIDIARMLMKRHSAGTLALVPLP
jgi:DNA polymerase-3 subunit epsilon